MTERPVTPEADAADSATRGADDDARPAPAGRPGDRPRRLGRFAALDARPVNLDGFAERDDV